MMSSPKCVNFSSALPKKYPAEHPTRNAPRLNHILYHGSLREEGLSTLLWSEALGVSAPLPASGFSS